jgi:hypothetical protein
MAIDLLVTIGTLRDQHLALMREWQGLTDEAKRTRAADMRRIAVEAGKNIESPMERDEAQGIVDYWASAIASLPGGSYPELLTIDDYTSTQAVDAGRSVCEAYEALQPQEAQRLARSILMDLLVLGDHGVERDLPRSRQALQKSAGTTDTNMFDAALATLVKSGAVIRRASESRADDYFEAADGRIAESWPALEEWLLSAKSYAVERARLMDLAQRWSDAGRRPDLLLLTSGDVENALGFKNEDDLLDTYIEASRRARGRVRQLTFLILTLAVITLSITSFISWQKMKDAETRLHRAEAENAKADQRFAAANADAGVAQLPDQSDARTRQSIGPGITTPTDPTAGRALENLDAVKGAMWLGSNDAPQVSTLQGGRVTNLAQATRGTRYRTRLPIYLRLGMPASGTNYTPPGRKAIIPAGAQVVLQGPPQAFARESGIQYWAAVQVVPQVYVQYNHANPAEVDRLRRQLADAGFEVPAGERREDFANGVEVRFFQTADQPIASLLQRVLNGTRPAGGRADAECRNFTGSAFVAANFKLELWYDPRPPQVEKAGDPCQ